MSDLSDFEKGRQIREEVLGPRHVAASMASASEFARPIQEMVTAVCWGSVWSRPGLSRQSRSLLNVAMLTALNRQHELAVHVAGALRNGCTEEQIRETLLQAAVYCGFPASLDAFRTAEAALARHAEQTGDTVDAPVEAP